MAGGDDDAGELARLRQELAETRAKLEQAWQEAETWRGRAEAARREIERALAEANLSGTGAHPPSPPRAGR
ncbi:MAG TPA: hypothetical protein VFY87_26770 [Geminicoccaceae bacterium]|nr:hypothetical protein [Geminicoccaceae bacterium]